jgi:hypothetical protein
MTEAIEPTLSPESQDLLTVDPLRNEINQDPYITTLSAVVDLMAAARHAASRSVNAIMTATYWEIGRQIVQLEQKGDARAEYGKQIIARLAKDLGDRLGRGFQKSNLFQMRAFYLNYAHLESEALEPNDPEIFQTLSGKFPLPWSHYVKLLSLKSADARTFYEQRLATAADRPDELGKR